jgi:hypothetical protein
MICKLPKCDKIVPMRGYKTRTGLRFYCCEEHTKIGQRNNITKRDAKLRGKETYLCKNSKCNVVYMNDDGSGECHKCRAKGRVCIGLNCNTKIPDSRDWRTKYCSDTCRARTTIAKKTARYHKNKVLRRDIVLPPEEKTPKGKKLFAAGKYYRDFRRTICKTYGKICANYSKCSDSAMPHKHGAFKYQTNGGINCYEAPATVNRVNYGNSLGVCSENR